MNINQLENVILYCLIQRQLDRYNAPTLASVPFSIEGLSETFQASDWFVKIEEPTEKVDQMVSILQNMA